MTFNIPKNDPLALSRDLLTIAGYTVDETRQIPHGWQHRCSDGVIVNVYKTSKVFAQGSVRRRWKGPCKRR